MANRTTDLTTTINDTIKIVVMNPHKRKRLSAFNADFLQML